MIASEAPKALTQGEAELRKGVASQKGTKEHMHAYADIAKAGYTRGADLSHHNLSHLPEFSNRNRQTYIDNTNKHVVISHRGTNPKIVGDLTTDAALALGYEHLTSRFKNASKHLKHVQQTYPHHKITSVGHSLGGTISLHLNKKHRVDAVAYNPGVAVKHALHGVINKVTNFLFRSNKPKSNATVYSTHGDVVSALSPTLSNAQVFVKKTNNKNKHSLSNFFKRKI